MTLASSGDLLDVDQPPHVRGDAEAPSHAHAPTTVGADAAGRSQRDEIPLRVGQDVVVGAVAIRLLLDDAGGRNLLADVGVLVVRELCERKGAVSAA